MNKKEFMEIFGKSTFIEHLNAGQQTELWEIAKNLVNRQYPDEECEKCGLPKEDCVCGIDD